MTGRGPPPAEPNFCASCGHALPAGAAFCPTCGVRVGVGGAADPPAAVGLPVRSAADTYRKRRLLAAGTLVLLAIGVVGSLSTPGRPAPTPTAPAPVRVAQPVATAPPKPTLPPPPTATLSPDQATRTAMPTPDVTFVPTPPPSVGDTVEGQGWTYRVTGVGRARDMVWSSYGYQEAAKGVWVVVGITLTNTGRQNYAINSWDFELHDGAGVRYVPTDTTSTRVYARQNGRALLGDPFPPDVPVRAFVVFDVAPAITQPRLWLVQERRHVGLGELATMQRLDR